MKRFYPAIFATLVVVLSACGNLTPTASVQRGVDEIGPYEIVAATDIPSGFVARPDATTKQSTVQTGAQAKHTVQLRKYANTRYGTWLIIQSGTTRTEWYGKLNVRYVVNNRREVRGLDTRARLQPGQTWSGNTGGVTLPAGLQTVCARVEGEFTSSRGEQNYSRYNGHWEACLYNL